MKGSISMSTLVYGILALVVLLVCIAAFIYLFGKPLLAIFNIQIGLDDESKKASDDMDTLFDINKGLVIRDYEFQGEYHRGAA